MNHCIIAWGTEVAKLESRPEWVGVSSPWRHLAKLMPGQSWFELPEPDIQSQSQICVQQELTSPIPPEAVAAKELVLSGASEAFVIENWLGVGVMSHELMGVAPSHRVWELIEQYKQLSGKRGGGGFPDVVAFWPSQRVSVCEVKIKGKDRLNPNQVQAVSFLREMLGDNLDLRVFEWLGVTGDRQVCSPG